MAQLAFSGPLAGCFRDVQFVTMVYALPGGKSLLDSDAGFNDVRFNIHSCS